MPDATPTPTEMSVCDDGVVVEDLVIRYGELIAVDGASFTAPPAAVTVVLGPNGAGKTSTIEHLEGYRRSTSGRSRVLGMDPVREHRALTRRVGIMLQSGGIPNGIRATELLQQYAGFFASPRDPAELLVEVGLAHRAATVHRKLSGGEQQRLSLALALIGRPRVVFLDEPTAGVDLDGRDRIRKVVQELRRDGVCVVIATHDLDEAERCADHIVIMDRGRVVGSGTPAELMGSGAGDALRFGAPAGLDVEALSTAAGSPVIEVSAGEYRVAAAPSPRLVAEVTRWLADHDLQLADLRADRERLDDVFRRLTEEPAAGAVDDGPPPDRARARPSARARHRGGRGR